MLAAGAFGLLAFWGGDAAAQQSPTEPNGPDWALGYPAGEAVVGALSAASLTTLLLPQQATGWAPSSHRSRDDAVGMVSDFVGDGIGSAWQILGGWAFEVGYYEEHEASLPYARALRSSLIDTEAVFLSTGITVALKSLTGRCRPRAWQVDEEGEGRCVGAQYDAFPSGHTSAVGAVAGSRFVLAVRSTGVVSWRYAAFALAEAATLTTAALRVLAGAHSWEDVLGGWVLGHGTGMLVGVLHPMVATPHDAEAAAPAQDASTLSWGGRW